MGRCIYRFAGSLGLCEHGVRLGEVSTQIRIEANPSFHIVCFLHRVSSYSSVSTAPCIVQFQKPFTYGHAGIEE